MKSGRLFFLASVGLSLATACGDNTSTPSDGGGTSNESGSGSGSGSSSGGGSGSGSGATNDSGTGPETGTMGADCTTDPCNQPLVCCPADNTCTTNSSLLCSATVNVACTKAADCPGMHCCIGASSTTGSGPTGSLCAATCDQGFACGKGLVADCPNGGVGFASCAKISNSPASLGGCVPSAGDDGGSDTGSPDAGGTDSGTGDAIAPKDASKG
jgi:hypothetical protein